MLMMMIILFLENLKMAFVMNLRSQKTLAIIIIITKTLNLLKKQKAMVIIIMMLNLQTSYLSLLICNKKGLLRSG